MSEQLSPIRACLVDYRDPTQARDLVRLLDHYAQDPMGGGKGLKASVKEGLAAQLAQLPQAFSIMLYSGDAAVALANCFEVFSTFEGRLVVNIHDFVVHRDYRGNRLSQQLLAKVEEVAARRGCCKLTLEVLSGNRPAQKAYRQFGFKDYELDAETGQALFWQKSLPS